ncbi:Transposase [Shigella dysenteriae 1617]|uniref:Transposase n=1 Tax=Shigella dysenteriae 1617 TaxID=754093 RepID=A0A0A6ZUF3_SHIDY|nr:Transposase [Shigella dysenteriae 1617]
MTWSDADNQQVQLTTQELEELATAMIQAIVERNDEILSLPEGPLGQWVTAARKGLGTPGSRTVAELESEILQLRKALNEARLGRDIIKKATAYFAQESLENTR